MNKNEDIEDVLSEMEEFRDHGDVTYNMRCKYVSRLRAALLKHDTDLMMKCMQTAINQITKIKEEK